MKRGARHQSGIEVTGRASVLKFAAGSALVDVRAKRTGNHLTLTLRGACGRHVHDSELLQHQAGLDSEGVRRRQPEGEAILRREPRQIAEARNLEGGGEGPRGADFVTAFAQRYLQVDADTR